MDQRFRQRDRINEPAEFRRAFDRKRSASNASLIVYGAENGLDHPRLGISASRKRVRKAHDRNACKRALREAFRMTRADLPNGVDLVVVPRGPGLTYAEARASLPELARAVARRLAIAPSRVVP